MKFGTHLPLFFLHLLNVCQDSLTLRLLLVHFPAHFLKHLLQLINLVLQDLACIGLRLELLLPNLNLLVRLLRLLFPQLLRSIQLLERLITLSFQVIQLCTFVLIGRFLILSLSFKHFEKQMVGHDRIALVTYSVLLLVKLAQLASRLAAALTDALTTPSAVFLL